MGAFGGPENCGWIARPVRPCGQAHSRCGETRVPAPLAFEAGAEYGTRNTLRSLSHERCEDRIFGRDIHN